MAVPGENMCADKSATSIGVNPLPGDDTPVWPAPPAPP